MRLSLLIPAVALLALSACDAPSRPKTAAVSVPVQNPNCPSTPLTCPPATPVAAPAAKVAAPHSTPAKTKARRHPPVVRKVAARRPVRVYARPDITAEGLLPPHPLPYVPEGPMAGPPHYAHPYARHSEGYRGGQRGAPYRPDRGDRDHYAYDEEYRGQAYRRGYRDGYANAERGGRRGGEAYEERREGGSYSERSESYSERRAYYGDDCDCRAPPQAAGRDRYGFLTWPGKVPARP